jgi:hypothetical protein
MTIGLEAAAEWSPFRRQRAAERLASLANRQRIVSSYAHPAELMAACNEDYVITPAVELVSRKIEQVLRSRRKRLMISAPPQEFKSMLCAVTTPIRALQLHPNWRVMLLTYADGLAEEHSRAARALIQQFGSGVVDSLTGQPLPDRLGIRLHPQLATASNWRIAEGDGGLVAAGRDATITGKRADLLIVDDPFKNMQEADSHAMRTKIIEWYHSVATTRLAPGASIIIIQTRWHPEDLCGQLLTHDKALERELREWHYINIPAISHPAIPDALDRPPGVALESARGRTAEDFRAIERSVGKRVWNALYQGSPTPPEGGLFSQAWFDAHRLAEMPERTRVRIVTVDPAESGEGDEAGVIGAALLYPPNGVTQTVTALMSPEDAPPPIHPQVALTHDRSGQMTSDAWGRAAVDLALETDASYIFIETYTAGTTYINVVKTEISRRMQELARKRDSTEEERRLLAQLHALFNRVQGWRGTGDAVARSGLLRQAVEVGTCVVLGHELAAMEDQAVNWTVGRHQPDRVAASVIAHDRLMSMLGKQAQIARPIGSPVGRNPWLTKKVG